MNKLILFALAICLSLQIDARTNPELATEYKHTSHTGDAAMNASWVVSVATLDIHHQETIATSNAEELIGFFKSVGCHFNEASCKSYLNNLIEVNSLGKVKTICHSTMIYLKEFTDQFMADFARSHKNDDSARSLRDYLNNVYYC